MLNPIRPKRRAVFTTFYSFKGGVGRTMALLNTACILAGRGRRVLMIDFDLEAPGLTNLALKNIAHDTGPSSNGLVELITDFLSDPEHSPLNDEQNRAPFFSNYVRQLEIPASLKQLDTGYLHLLPCGRIDATYTDRLYSIDFKQLYAEGVGQPLFKYLKTFLRDSDKYDYVLIDSRTGFSDEGGICTRDLADHIFVVMGLNRQNVDGTVQFLHRLEAGGWKEGRLIFIASPVPVGEEELRSKRMATAREAIEQTRFKADFQLRIPYHPRLALDEEPFLFNWSETDLFPVYSRITRVVRELADDTPQVLSQNITENFRQRQFDTAITELRLLYAEEPNSAVTWLTSLTTNLGEITIRFAEEVEPFFILLLEFDYSARQQEQYARFLFEAGKSKEAIAYAISAKESYINNGNAAQAAGAMLSLGNFYTNNNQIKEAMAAYEEAKSLYDTSGNSDGTTAAYLCMAATYADLGQYKQSLALAEDAVLLLRQTQSKLLSNGLNLYGAILQSIGEYETASNAFREALQASHNIGDQEDIIMAHESIGLALINQRLYSDAKSDFLEYLHLLRTLNKRKRCAAVENFLGYIRVKQGDASGLESMESAIQTLEAYKHDVLLVQARLAYADALLSVDAAASADYLGKHWKYIHDCSAPSVARYEAYVLRAKIKATLGDVQGAVEDAQVAVNFYREQDVHTILAQEAEELVKLGEKSAA